MESEEHSSSTSKMICNMETPKASANIKIQRYTPGVSTYSRRRTDEEWETYRQLLTRMHEQHYTRRQMIEALKNRDFIITSGQLLAQLKKWDLMVYGHGSRGVSKTNMQSKMPQSGAEQVIDVRRRSSSNESTSVTSPEIEGLQDISSTARQPLESTISRLSIDPVVVHNQNSTPEHVQKETSGSSPHQDLLGSNEEHSDTADHILKPKPTLSRPIKPPLAGHMTSEESLIQQLPLITEPWCKNFPTTCCCHSFFNGIGDFAASPELYLTVLRQSSPSSLKHVLALLNLSENQTRFTVTVDVKEPLWLAITYYLQICTRSTRKNSLARSILYRLLRAWETIGEERISLPTEIFAKRQVESRSSLFARMFRAKAVAVTEESKKRFDWEASSDRDIGMLVGFTARSPSTFPLMNWSGQEFGSPATWTTPFEEPKSNDLVLTAKVFADYMESEWVEVQTKNHAPGSALPAMLDLDDYDSPLVFRSLGLMLALELSYYADDLMHSHRNGQLSDAATWSKELRLFVDTTVSTLSLNAEYAEKFRKSYWLASIEKIGYQGKIIHTGPCDAKTEWQILERDIHEYDEERTWIERRLFSGRGSWPQTEDLMMSDNASVRSVSSINSFRRFQALAFHLKVGTPHSRSVRTKSTKSVGSKMSLDSHLSWQLEHMLGLQEEEEVDEEKVQNKDKQINAQLEKEVTKIDEANEVDEAEATNKTVEGRLESPHGQEEDVAEWQNLLDSAFRIAPTSDSKEVIL